ncbi:putative 2OG-Fe(II) oxygenase [Phenylobacterium sp.]|uniref:putative 2OG-Fe(II) oxygenase n=1 Tax=Phenylobacterium sp. TaxID=1871053 RepID=UPI0035AF8107
MTKDILDEADALLARGRPAEAEALTRPLAEAADAPHRALATHATALKALGRRDEALPFNERAIERYATSGVAWHNYASTLGDMGKGAASIAACERAFALKLDAAETWAVYARALLAVGERDRAEEAYRQSLARQPANVVTAAEYANVIWMRRGDLAEAERVIDACFRGGGHPGLLLSAKAKLYEASGDAARSANLLAAGAARIPGDPALLLSAAQAMVDVGRIADAEELTRRAELIAPAESKVFNQWAIVHLAAGRPGEALAKAREGLALYPDDQSLWGWAATAARAAGDPLYGELCDYDQVVAAYDIATPDGWTSLEAFLGDLAKSLNKLHGHVEHPTTQSLRHGSQTLYLLTGSDDPAIQAAFKAFDAPIRQHMARLGPGTDVLRRRNTGDYRFQGAWSVRLEPEGFHKDHFHPEGWLSSAFYVETPDAALDREDKEGWIRFGQPPVAADPPLPAERYIRPKPGRLVLFPSYMWHGTVPFTTDEARMTIAFDVTPK